MAIPGWRSIKNTAVHDRKIIGGGTAGLTVAKRLAESPGISVAVIEAGSFYEINNGNFSQVPAYDVLYSSSDPASIQPLVDWGIVTIPQQVRKHKIQCQTLVNFLYSNYSDGGYTILRANASVAGE